MTSTPRLRLPYLMQNQAQKHVTLNESLRQLDALVQLSVMSASTAEQPATPGEGDVYILPAGASGEAWDAATAGNLAAYQDGAWAFVSPGEGWIAYVRDEALPLVFGAGSWSNLTVREASLFGVNAAPDTTNRLAVKSDAELLSHDDVTPGSGDARKVINRADSARTASVLFQSGFQGAAEIGLCGDDDFTLRVSADGLAFEDALRVSTDTGDFSLDGKVAVGKAAATCALDVAGPIRCGAYTMATLPSASATGAGAIIHIYNESGGATLAFSDGTNWRRVADRAVVS